MAVQPHASPTARGGAARLPSPNLQRQQEEEGRVRDNPSANFVLAQPPDEWMLTEDGDLLPVIVPLSRSPGVQGVDRRGNFGDAEAYYRSRHFTLIPHDLVPGDYVAAYKNTRGQAVHKTIFQEPVEGAGGTEWLHDNEAWRTFVELLFARGIVRAPKPHIVRGMLEAKRREYEHLRPPAADDASRRDAYDRRVAMLRKHIESLTGWLEKAEAEHGAAAAPSSAGTKALLDAALADAKAGRPVQPSAGKATGKGRGKGAAPPAGDPGAEVDDEDSSVDN